LFSIEKGGRRFSAFFSSQLPRAYGKIVHIVRRERCKHLAGTISDSGGKNLKGMCLM